MEDTVNSSQCSNALASILEEACNQSMPMGLNRGGNKAAYWWNQEIDRLRKKCHSCRRQLKRKRLKSTSENNDVGQDDYKEARNKLRFAIERSKKGCWYQLCNQVETDPWGLREEYERYYGCREETYPRDNVPWAL